MEQTKRPQGRPRKKHRAKALKDQAVHGHEQSWADADSSDAGAPPVDADVNPSNAGVRPAGANVGRSDIGRPSAGASVDLPGTGTPPADVDEASEFALDSNTGLKPSYSDGNTSDQSIEVEDFLPEEAGEDVQNAMMDMMLMLEDDRWDPDWLPPKERKKRIPKRIGMISLRE